MHGTAGIPQAPEWSASNLHVSYRDGIWNFLPSEPAFLHLLTYRPLCRLILLYRSSYSTLYKTGKLSTSLLYKPIIFLSSHLMPVNLLRPLLPSSLTDRNSPAGPAVSHPSAYGRIHTHAPPQPHSFRAHRPAPFP